jgi:putative spermidine/putrescine transport system permease protein
MNKNGNFAVLFHSSFVVFILAPLAIVVFISFTPEAYLALPTTGLSLRWFRAIAENREFISAFWLSLGLGLLSASFALVLSVPAALAIHRFRFLGRDAVIAIFLSPLIVPHIVLGVAFLRFFASVGLLGTYTGLVCAHILMILPFGLRLVLASLANIDVAAEKAAVSLGATPWRTFVRVTLPLLVPGIAGGWLICFIQSFDEVTMTVFLASPSTTTLPVQLLHHMTDSIDPLVASVSTVVIALTFGIMFVIDRFYGLEKVLIGKGG